LLSQVTLSIIAYLSALREKPISRLTVAEGGENDSRLQSTSFSFGTGAEAFKRGVRAIKG
jgi:hypothetical protein